MRFCILPAALAAASATAQETNQAAPFDPRLYPDPTFFELAPSEKAEFEMIPRPNDEADLPENIQYLVDVSEPWTQEDATATIPTWCATRMP